MATTITEAFHYDPFSPQAMREPHSLYPALREEHPAYYIPEYDTYVFSRYDDVWNGFMDAQNFSEAEGQLFTREDLLVHHRGNPPQPRIEPEKAMFLWLDPPVQTKFRQALAAPFLKGNIRKLEELITQITRARLAELLPRGRFDLNMELASHVSASVVMHVMGMNLGDPVGIAEKIGQLVARDPDRPGMTPAGAVAREELHAKLRAEVARRRAGVGPDSFVIDALIHGDMIGRPLTDAEIAVDLMSLLVGGTETLPKIFAGGLLELSRHPHQLAEVAADPANATPAFEEMLRYNAPAQWFGRTVKQPVTLGGVDLEPGQRVILLLASANRDDREFGDGDAFRWNRKARRMISFGVGPHFCIGIHLARLEGQVLLREFLSAVPEFTIEPENGSWAESEFQVGWTSLPVRVGR